MSKAEIHAGDTNTHIGLVIRQEGLAVDLSTATSIMMTLEKPDGTIIAPATRLETTGEDGRMYVNSAAGWLDQVGTWRKQGVVEVGGKTLHSDIIEFRVHEVLG